jgi:hypothetical protein
MRKGGGPGELEDGLGRLGEGRAIVDQLRGVLALPRPVPPRPAVYQFLPALHICREREGKLVWGSWGPARAGAVAGEGAGAAAGADQDVDADDAARRLLVDELEQAHLDALRAEDDGLRR